MKEEALLFWVAEAGKVPLGQRKSFWFCGFAVRTLLGRREDDSTADEVAIVFFFPLWFCVFSMACSNVIAPLPALSTLNKWQGTFHVYVCACICIVLGPFPSWEEMMDFVYLVPCGA